jgi:hypothetical protein
MPEGQSTPLRRNAQGQRTAYNRSAHGQERYDGASGQRPTGPRDANDQVVPVDASAQGQERQWRSHRPLNRTLGS